MYYLAEAGLRCGTWDHFLLLLFIFTLFKNSLFCIGV